MGLGKGQGRPPEAKAKSHQLIVKAKPEEEVELAAFKELCARNGIKIRDEIFTRTIRPFLREHNWPPGNSQTVIDVYTTTLEEKKELICERCGEKTEQLYEAMFISGKKLKECKNCFEHAKNKKLVKKFLRVMR